MLYLIQIALYSPCTIIVVQGKYPISLNTAWNLERNFTLQPGLLL
jgi:hypothetical protein